MPDPATLHEVGWIIGELAALVAALAIFFNRTPTSPAKVQTTRSEAARQGGFRLRLLKPMPKATRRAPSCPCPKLKPPIY
jgi:hypothetical protein